jgi:Putative beta-barrel porin-2, OmpL-like. bbp2
MQRKMMAVIMGMWGMGLILGVGGSIQSAVAADPAPTLEERVKALEDRTSNIDISGFVDVYYSLNFQHPGPAPGIFGNQALRAFDVQADKFSLSMAELVIQKAPGTVPVGFRVDLDYGPSADIVGSFDPGGIEVYKEVQQAYVTYVAPIGKGLTIDFGKFVTHMGNEVIESKDNWNYSRGLLFTWAIPFYHAGLRVTYPVVDGVTVTLLGVNGWNNVAAANAGKNVGAQIIVSLIPKVTLVQNAIWGSVTAPGLRRDVYDTIVTVTPTDKLSLAVNFDYGNDDGSGVSGTGQSAWYGVAGYGRYAFTDATALALRGEWFKDADGYLMAALVPSGGPQTLGEVTVTGEWKIANTILTRLEYRRDWSNQTPFFNGGIAPNSHAQDTLTLGAVYTF